MKYVIILVLTIFLLCSCAPAENIEAPQEQSGANSSDIYDDIELIDERLVANESLKAMLCADDNSFPVDVTALYASGTDRGFAKEADLSEYGDFFKNLEIPKVTAFYLATVPAVYEKDSYTLTDDEAVDILSKFKEFELGILPESEYENYYTGGGWEWYIATEDGDWFFSYNGLWLNIVNCQTLERITYTLEWNTDFWESMDALMAEKLVDLFSAALEAESFYGVATTLGFDIPFRNPNDKLGDADDAAYIFDILSRTTAASIEYIAIEIGPHDIQKDVELDKDSASNILDLLKTLEFEYLEETQNPDTGGLTLVYIKTTESEFYFSFNGILGFAEKDAPQSYTFAGTAQAEQVFAEIYSIAEELIIQ